MCLRQELREIAYDIASSSNMDGGNQNTGVVPPPYISTTNSELYHTHLYTQLWENNKYVNFSISKLAEAQAAGFNRKAMLETWDEEPWTRHGVSGSQYPDDVNVQCIFKVGMDRIANNTAIKVLKTKLRHLCLVCVFWLIDNHEYGIFVLRANSY